MTVAEIENVIKQIEDGEFEKAIDLLKMARAEAIIGKDKGKIKLLTAVKTVLKAGSKCREILGKVQTRNGKHFVCDGYMLVEWKHEQEEIKELPTAKESESINIEAIKPRNFPEYQMTERDLLLLNNLDKYIKMYSKEFKENKILTSIPFCGKYVNVKLLKQLDDCISDWKTIKTTTAYNTPITVENDNEYGLILPVKILVGSIEDKKIIERIDEMVSAFCEIVKE